MDEYRSREVESLKPAAPGEPETVTYFVSTAYSRVPKRIEVEKKDLMHEADMDNLRMMNMGP